MRGLSTAALATASLLLGACAPRGGTVLPLPDQRYEASALGQSRDAATRSALQAAEQRCGREGARPVVLARAYEYQGLVDEQTRRALEQVQEVAVVSTGTVVPSLSRDDDYRAILQFRCER
ncbi:MAG TPA: hypothetical protein VFV27_08765 [Nevskiaceae bacterium]|nr:hypothetical protein [Nevskiaceae bacterium]